MEFSELLESKTDNNDINVLIKRICRLNNIMGKRDKRPTKSEISNGHVKSFRRGVFLNKDLKKGSVITYEDLICLRPNVGIDMRHFYKIIDKKLNTDVSKLQALNFDLFI